jgi:plasmid stabilization system protein ParE
VEEAWPVKVRYTNRALAQIDGALAYIEAQSPQGAVHVCERIFTLVSLLQERPYAGRATSRRNVRRVPVNPYPYLIDYRIGENEIIIMRFRHSARRPLYP